MINIFNVFEKSRNSISDTFLTQLEKLEDGDISLLPTIYCSLARGNKRVIEQGVKYIKKVISSLPTSRIINLDENFRNYTSMEWTIDWSKVIPDNILSQITDKEERLFFLGVGTFHPNGYYREKCLHLLADYGEDALPYALLRVNDWVRPIQVQAFQISKDLIGKCNSETILKHLPYLYKIQQSGRRDSSYVDEVKKIVTSKFREKPILFNQKLSSQLDNKPRRLYYDIFLNDEYCTAQNAIYLLRCEPDSFNRRLVAQLVLKHWTNSTEITDQLLEDKSPLVRRIAIEFKFDQAQKIWNGCEKHLLDKNQGVREYCQFFMKKYQSIDLTAFYLQHLSDLDPIGSILGLGETAHQDASEHIIPFLQSERIAVVKAALISIGRLCGESKQDLFYEYLLDSRRGVSKQAYKLIQTLKCKYPCSQLYQDYMNETNPEHVKKSILMLICTASAWERLIYLMLLVKDADEEAKTLALNYLNKWNYTFMQPTEKQRQKILEVFESAKDVLPLATMRKIEFDLSIFQIIQRK